MRLATFITFLHTLSRLFRFIQHTIFSLSLFWFTCVLTEHEYLWAVDDGKNAFSTLVSRHNARHWGELMWLSRVSGMSQGCLITTDTCGTVFGASQSWRRFKLVVRYWGVFRLLEATWRLILSRMRSDVFQILSLYNWHAFLRRISWESELSLEDGVAHQRVMRFTYL